MGYVKLFFIIIKNRIKSMYVRRKMKRNQEKIEFINKRIEELKASKKHQPKSVEPIVK